MNRYYYSDRIEQFLQTDTTHLIGILAENSEFEILVTQRNAWREQIAILKATLQGFSGQILFEYSIPRMGARIDVVLLIGACLFVLEFKVGETEYSAHAMDQVWDYALDLKNFHETSHNAPIIPILVATAAKSQPLQLKSGVHNDKVFVPVKCNAETLHDLLTLTLREVQDTPLETATWAQGRYWPTPTIIEAAIALYRGHQVAEISRSDAGAINLRETTQAISGIIANAKAKGHKAICFVTGVPGAGKTLVGLNIATKHLDAADQLYSVFLSGNDPLVKVLQEALARDQICRAKAQGQMLTKGVAHSRVRAFVQNVHHYRDDCVSNPLPPADHVALFDEAQRAWNKQQTCKFMRQKKGHGDFDQSEPEFLISCVDRHPDCGVVICLVGGGQEINTGEAGIAEWIDALNRRFRNWHIHISKRLTDKEYDAQRVLKEIAQRDHVTYHDDLHLSVSMRSYRAEHVSQLVKEILDVHPAEARATLQKISANYPIVLTRNIHRAKEWLRQQARGSERYGLVASSSAERLRPQCIHVKAPMNPIHWFLAGKDDIRSSYYLEDVATEFDIQGLELDWICVTWDGDLRLTGEQWRHFSFVVKRWNRVKQPERQKYLENAYRVLLTRARQGMVIVVPEGDPSDPTRAAEYYDPTFKYLQGIGFPTI